MSDFPEFDPGEQTRGEVIQHEPPANDRSLARRIALQILYEVDSARHDVGTVMAIHLQARQVSRKVTRYVRRLVLGVIQHRAALDTVIRQFAPEWPIDQMAIVDRNVLRMAIFELGLRGQTPVGVAIDEAVTLGKLFGAESSPGFINGVLGAVAEDEQILASLGLSDPDAAGDQDE